MTVGIRSSTGGALSVVDRARVISDSLRRTAGLSRFAPKAPAPVAYVTLPKRRDVVTPILFVCLFLVPALVGVAYYGAVASDRYVTEASFALRPAMSDRGDPSDSKSSESAAASVPQAMITQDTKIIREYIQSRPMVEALERKLPLRAMFSRAEIDYPSRLGAAKPIEKVLPYWNDRVDVSFSTESGVITIQVNAFTAEDSLAVTRAILEESERMINEFSARMRNRSLEETEASLTRAESQLTKVRLAQRDLRNREGVLDGERTAIATQKLVSDLKGQSMQLVMRQSSLARDLSPDSRSMQELTTQIRQIDEAAAKLERATTAQGPQERGFTETLGRFEALETERRNAERYYTQAIAAHERARIIADRQLEFFSPVVEPMLASSPQAPRRLLAIVNVIAAAASLFVGAAFLRRAIA